MANSIYIAMSSALASQKRLDVVANNIANANTPGFRQQRVVFSEELVATFDGRPSEKGFTAVAEASLDTEAGELEHTGNPLDVAIDGDGYFVMRGANGLMVSRAGTFRTAADGTLVDGSGMPVLGGSIEDGLTPITTSPDGGRISVGADGTVAQGGTELARLAVVTSTGPGLSPTGGAHLSAPDGSLQSVDAPSVASGYVENSNVNPVRGMVELIEISHAYQTSQKLMNETRKLDRAVMTIVR